MWLAMYFGMNAIGCHFANIGSHEPVRIGHENVKRYRSLCAKALALAGMWQRNDEIRYSPAF
jgi:hypothetical protein